LYSIGLKLLTSTYHNEHLAGDFFLKTYTLSVNYCDSWSLL